MRERIIEEVGITLEVPAVSYKKTISLVVKEKSIVRELHDDIITKLKPANYTGNERKYVEGALKHIDFLVDENVNFLKNKNADIATGFYDGKLNITHSDNSLRDDIKITIFHEYLHHVNYMEKIYPYRYSDESTREIFKVDDDCFYEKEMTMDDFLSEYIVTKQLQDNSNWNKEKFSDLGKKEQEEIQEYYKDDTKIVCKKDVYRPSNYYRDEITVYTICLKENHNLYTFSDRKENMAYRPNLLEYKEALRRSVIYEQKNN